MMARLALRLLREVAPRPLAKLALNFGVRGIDAVRRFEQRRARGEHFPAFLFISVTNACNLRCQGCWVSPTSPPDELDFATVDSIVREAVRHGVSTFGILGGEPLLYRGLMDLFQAHPDCYFILFTNGTLVDDEVAAGLRQAGNVSPLVSIEGSEVVSDERRGGTGVYRRSLRGLECCTRNGLFTGVATSVCRSNIDDLASERFVEQLAGLGAHYLWYYIYRPVGPDPVPELALSPQQVLDLRRFMVEIRTRAPLLVVDAYWDHEGRAMCPAAVGIGHHISPAGFVEPCPPIQFACDRVNGSGGLHRLLTSSQLLREFREVTARATRGCIIMEQPELLLETMQSAGARDSSGRLTAHAELAAMQPCASHHMPGQEIPEISWPYRFAKKNWFFGFGAYG